MNQLTKLALEMGPLILFFAVNATTNLMTATAVFVTATVVALVVSYAIARTIPVMPLIGGAFVIVFGGLTLYLDNDLFIKKNILPFYDRIVKDQFGIRDTFHRSPFKMLLHF